MYSGYMFNAFANTMNNDEKNAWNNFAAVLNSQPNTMATTTVKNQDT